jgi:hypothetical protein
LLDNIPGTVFTLGDNAYSDGTDAEFNECYDPTWGRHKARTRPAPGNHDYNTTGASGYFNYFGSAAGEPGKGYYSYDSGAWHIIVLNTECREIGGCESSSPQGQWLQADLLTNPSVCTLAYSHIPRFSSGQHGNSSTMENFVQLLYEAGADVVLSGHDHDYERFAPQDPNGALDVDRGIRQFVVGTGGKGLRPFATIQPNSEVRESNTHGVLKLSLHSTSYDWEFVPIAGQTFTDSGSASCVAVPLANQAPSVDAGPDQTITWPDSATLDGTVTDDGLPSPPGALTTTWSMVSGSGMVTFTDAFTVDTVAGFSQVGTYVLRLTAGDGEFIASDEVTIVVIEPGAEVTPLESQVAASSDDAEENASGGVSLTSSDLELVVERSNQTVGIRFNSITIPQGAIIANAYVQFQVDETSSEATSLTIQGEADDNAATFISANGNISSRPRTTAAVSWSPTLWTTVGEAGPDQQTPDIALVIQEIVNRPGWSSGNSLVVIITGSGKRVAESYDGDQNGAPLLYVEYLTGAANQAPTATVTAPAGGSTFSSGELITFDGNAIDAEDGDLTAGLSWSSNIDAIIGTGGSFTRSDLSIGMHTIVVTVTDSGGLTGTAQITLSVEVNSPPTVTITTPASGSIFIEGELISFSGSAGDAEDEDLTTGLAWQSDLDGGIGSGGSFATSSLTVGVHTITATVTDSGGLTGTAQISLTVKANQPPTVTISTPGSGSIFIEGELISFSGSAGDTEDEDLTTGLAWQSDLDGGIGQGCSVLKNLVNEGILW